MSFLSSLNISQSLLIICVEATKEKFKEITKEFKDVKLSTPETLKEIEKSSVVNAYISTEIENISSGILADILKLLNPEGKLYISNRSNDSSLEFNLKVSGFINITVENDYITASKPKFSVGSSVKLNLKKPTVWKLDDEEEEDLIDPDDLLDDDDLKKPDPSSLKVCGTTGKRKACKDCSCGLAEELAVEAQSGKVVDTKDAPKSSCGNCYLGDAFRCASCPYLGMPAFKPGEKIQLTTAQLKSDI
ncbi:hypothetical protein GWI33_020534 [Rhynchophorus ferrugineus]|uniref:Anamorsin homolog n=1 Tax=Rhynchophorus ferrugineus TaxID=354439 RepID=A0A834HQF8_RHYFE|nr:hypothetical protein GWI33_020534 [Rhynchophorus ferrugineus]